MLGRCSTRTILTLVEKGSIRRLICLNKVVTYIRW